MHCYEYINIEKRIHRFEENEFCRELCATKLETEGKCAAINENVTEQWLALKIFHYNMFALFFRLCS